MCDSVKGCSDIHTFPFCEMLTYVQEMTTESLLLTKYKQYCITPCQSHVICISFEVNETQKLHCVEFITYQLITSIRWIPFTYLYTALSYINIKNVDREVSQSVHPTAKSTAGHIGLPKFTPYILDFRNPHPAYNGNHT